MIFSAIVSEACVGYSSKLWHTWAMKSDYGTRVPWDVFHKKYCRPAGEPGSGAGRGSGAGGSIREPGGGLGRFGSAQEEGYFLSKEKEQLSKIKKQMKENPDLVLNKKDK